MTWMNRPANFPIQGGYTLEIQLITLYVGSPADNGLRGTAARIKEYPLIKTRLSAIKPVLIALIGQQSLKKAKTWILDLAK